MEAAPPWSSAVDMETEGDNWLMAAATAGGWTMAEKTSDELITAIRYDMDHQTFRKSNGRRRQPNQVRAVDGDDDDEEEDEDEEDEEPPPQRPRIEARAPVVANAPVVAAVPPEEPRRHSLIEKLAAEQESIRQHIRAQHQRHQAEEQSPRAQQGDLPIPTSLQPTVPPAAAPRRPAPTSPYLTSLDRWRAFENGSPQESRVVFLEMSELLENEASMNSGPLIANLKKRYHDGEDIRNCFGPLFADPDVGNWLHDEAEDNFVRVLYKLPEDGDDEALWVTGKLTRPATLKLLTNDVIAVDAYCSWQIGEWDTNDLRDAKEATLRLGPSLPLTPPSLFAYLPPSEKQT